MFYIIDTKYIGSEKYFHYKGMYWYDLPKCYSLKKARFIIDNFYMFYNKRYHNKENLRIKRFK